MWHHPLPCRAPFRCLSGRDRDDGGRRSIGDNASVPDLVTTGPTTGSDDLFARARAVTPGGVNSPVRAFNAVGGTPRFIASASGPWLTDVDGNTYVDLVCSWGPMLLGHGHPTVVEAVQAAVTRGTSYGTPTEGEVALVEAIVARTPVDRLRLVSSGTEATMSAIRLARGFTGRDVVVKFAGCYHGHVDSLLAVGRLRADHLLHPGDPGRAGQLDRADPGAAVQRPRGGRRGLRRARRPDRVPDHRGRAGQHGRRPAGPRVQPVPRRDLPRARCPVHQRRGDDRVPRLARPASGAPTVPSRAGRPT